jgi:hypothetical protein
MSPDVDAAVDRLRREQVLADEQAGRFRRVARRELVSVRRELRVLLYGGILVAMAGVGLLVQQNFQRLGPLAVAAALTLAAAGCLAWVHRHAPPFSWGESLSPHIAFEYLLLLGVLLLGADLAYVETQFTPLGEAWPWHLFLVSLVSAVLAVRYDSRIVFSVALSTFAAWRGVSVALLETALWSRSGEESSIRANAIACGVLFIVLGAMLVRSGRKPHFEPVAVHLGWLLALGALASGLGGSDVAFGGALLLTGAGLAVFSFRRSRFSLFSLGVLGAYLALSALFLRTDPPFAAASLWFALTSLAVLAGLLTVHKRMKRPA